ncbi:MAG: hypothetical protein GX144_09075 [Clostridiaceae bacterium]|jgi:hypothetical protein|nr:hypothetical protein [Clostridiaceae bacterium]
MSSKSIRLGFIGFCKTDIILYMARILTCLGENVAVIDCSGQHELKLSVPDAIDTEDRLDYRGVDFYSNSKGINTAELPVKNYTILLVDYGVNLHALEKEAELEALFVVTDMHRHHVVPLSIVLSRLQFTPDAIRIIRDIVPGKIRPRYIDSLLQTGQFTNLLAKYELYLHEKDYYQRLLSQYDDIFHFAKISEAFRSMLFECVTELLGYDKKSATRALKKAQSGG